MITGLRAGERGSSVYTCGRYMETGGETDLNERPKWEEGRGHTA